MNLSGKMIDNVLEELEKSDKYEFLRKDKAFEELMAKYRTKK